MNKPTFTSFEDLKGIVDVFTDRPDKYMPALSLAQDILREESYLSPAERELIAAYTSKLNGCEYCCGSHTEFALSIGVDEDTIQKIVVNEDISDHPLSAILSYVKKLTKDPSTLTDQDRKDVIDAGFSEEHLKDAIAVCAIFNFYNRIVEGHGVLPSQEGYKTAATMINKHGYDRRY